MHILATVFALLLLLLNILYFPLHYLARHYLFLEKEKFKSFVEAANWNFDLILNSSKSEMVLTNDETLKKELTKLNESYNKYIFKFNEVFYCGLHWLDFGFFKNVFSIVKRQKHIMASSNLWYEINEDFEDRRALISGTREELDQSFATVKNWFDHNSQYFTTLEKYYNQELLSISGDLIKKLAGGFESVAIFLIEGNKIRMRIDTLSKTLKRMSVLDYFLNNNASKYINKINSYIEILKKEDLNTLDVTYNLNSILETYEQALVALSTREMKKILPLIDEFFHQYTLSSSNFYNQEIRNSFLIVEKPKIAKEIYNLFCFAEHLENEIQQNTKMNHLSSEESTKFILKISEVKTNFKEKMLKAKIIDKHEYSFHQDIVFQDELIVFDKKHLLNNFGQISPLISTIYLSAVKLWKLQEDVDHIIEKRYSARNKFTNSYSFFESIVSAAERLDYKVKKEDKDLVANILGLSKIIVEADKWLSDEIIVLAEKFDMMVRKLYVHVWPQIECINIYLIYIRKLKIDIAKGSRSAVKTLENARLLFDNTQYYESTKLIVDYYDERIN